MNISSGQKMNTQPRSEFRSGGWLPRIVGGLMLITLTSGHRVLTQDCGVFAQDGEADARVPSIENDVLRVSLSPRDGSLTVMDKRIISIGFDFIRIARDGFGVDTARRAQRRGENIQYLGHE